MAAVQAQLQRGVAVGAPMGHETEVCAELCSRVASLERARFTNSGTEASLHAVRLARAFTGRNLIAKFEGCYHGSHDAVGGQRRAAAGCGRPGRATAALRAGDRHVGRGGGRHDGAAARRPGGDRSADRRARRRAGVRPAGPPHRGSGSAGGLYPRRAGDHRPARRAHGLRRDRRLPAGPRRRSGVLRHHARPDHVREDRRRRLPGGSVRRTRRHHGPLPPDRRPGRRPERHLRQPIR